LLYFQVKTVPETQDKFGAPQEDWADSFEVWGAFEELGTREFPASHKVNPETTARFRIRYRAGIDPDKHRIRLVLDADYSPPASSYWNIQKPKAVGGRLQEMRIEATEIVLPQ
jgi:head-tail adaptor